MHLFTQHNHQGSPPIGDIKIKPQSHNMTIKSLLLHSIKTLKQTIRRQCRNCNARYNDCSTDFSCEADILNPLPRCLLLSKQSKFSNTQNSYTENQK